MFIKIFTELEKVKSEVIELIKKIGEAEEKKEEIFRALILKEAECEKLKKERDRLSNLCRIKDRIIEGDKKCCRK